MADINFDEARNLLTESLKKAERAFLDGQDLPLPDDAQKEAFDTVFSSNTQAYREVLLGCLVARLLDNGIDIHLPYSNQGETAFNGRSLDENVINPFLCQKRIQCSRGPYLSCFRRSITYTKETAAGLRDKAGYKALLILIDVAADAQEPGTVSQLLNYAMLMFVRLREESAIQLTRIKRISLEQCDSLINHLLNTQSGGRFPVLVVAATLGALKEVYELPWQIDCQGINVADKPSGAGGDITVRKNGNIILAAEITERVVDQSRVVATFNNKIAVAGIEDYLFFTTSTQNAAALNQTRQYFSQGHEINFVDIKQWVVMVLAIMGKPGRQIFFDGLVNSIDGDSIPVQMKAAWNEALECITSALI